LTAPGVKKETAAYEAAARKCVFPEKSGFAFDGILGVAGGVVNRALRLVSLSLCLQLGVAGHFPGCVFHGTFGVVNGAFNVFLVQNLAPVTLDTQETREATSGSVAPARTSDKVA